MAGSRPCRRARAADSLRVRRCHRHTGAVPWTSCKPRLVLCIGQAGGRAEVTPERIAINIDDGRMADNAGHQPVDVPVVPGAPAGVFLDAADQGHRARPACRRGAGVGVEQRRHFRLQPHLLRPDAPHRHASGGRAARGGFIHIPYLPEQAARFPGLPSMSLATVVEALRVAVATALAVEKTSQKPAVSSTERARRWQLRQPAAPR
jgi:pyroglutamyl-peptidase